MKFDYPYGGDLTKVGILMGEKEEVVNIEDFFEILNKYNLHKGLSI